MSFVMLMLYKKLIKFLVFQNINPKSLGVVTANLLLQFHNWTTNFMLNNHIIWLSSNLMLTQYSNQVSFFYHLLVYLFSGMNINLKTSTLIPICQKKRYVVYRSDQSKDLSQVCINISQHNIHILNKKRTKMPTSNMGVLGNIIRLYRCYESTNNNNLHIHCLIWLANASDMKKQYSNYKYFWSPIIQYICTI